MSVKTHNFKSKRWLLNYLLVAFIILIFGFGQSMPEEKKSAEILSFQPHDVERIEIITRHDHLLFTKQTNHWFLNKPFHWPASDINLKRLSSLVNLEPYKSVSIASVDPKTLGFNDASVILEVNEERIMFGDLNPMTDKRYLKIANTIHIVADNHLALILGGLTGLIDKTLLPKNIALEELSLPLITLTLDQSKSWQLDSNLEDYSVDQINQLISHWQTLESVKISPYDASNLALKTITAKTNLGEISFELFSLQPEIILGRKDLGLQYHFAAHFYDNLFSLKNQKQALSTAFD